MNKEALFWYQELIRRFEDKPDESYWGKEHNKTTRDAIGAAISALEKQIPKAVIEHTNGYWCPSCNVYYIGVIPVAGILTGTTPYCGNCGQRLEWSTQ